MSMLREGSVVITGGDLTARRNALAKILAGESVPIPENDPDIVLLAFETPKIGVGQVRNFLARLTTKPIHRPQKIGLILEAEKLTVEAQNALLKTLEEPPTACAIFLSVPHLKNLLPTTLSRCLTIQLDSLSKKATKFIGSDPSTLSLGEQFALAQKLAATRQIALDYLDNLSLALHQRILADPKMGGDHFRKILQAKKAISANANVRLTLENLFLDW